MNLLEEFKKQVENTGNEIATVPIKLENILEITETGYLKAEYLLDQLIQNNHISKITENVIARIDNLLYDDKKIYYALLDVQNQQVLLGIDKETVDKKEMIVNE